MKKYLVISEDEEVEYIILKHKNKITLISSDSDVWNDWFKFHKLISITDNEHDGIKIKWYERVIKNKLDYSQENYLHILLNFRNRHFAIAGKYKFMKSK